MKTGMMVFLLWVCTVFTTCFAMEPGSLRQLTSHPAQEGFPTWSPDGNWIAYSRYGADEMPEVTGLWIMRPDGSEPQRLTTVIAEHPDWSPDGRYIVFDGDYGESIQLVSAEGGTPIRIVPESIPVNKGGQPKWSPDGSRVVFKENSRLWVIDLASGHLETIFDAEDKLPIPAFWSRSSDEIYVWMREKDSRESTIWAMHPDGSGRRQVTPDKGRYRYASQSPDGSMLAVVWCEERNCDLWAMSPRGGPRAPITSHPAYDDGPAWSPNGKHIAFVSTRADHFDVWLLDADVHTLQRKLNQQ